MNSLHIVTVATESKYYFPYLVESCKKHGKEIEVLGYGEKWQGFNHKFKLMADYLKSLHPNDIVCFVDGYDVLCVRNLDELKYKFMEAKEKHKCKIIVAQDKPINNFFIFINNYMYGTCKKQQLNSGTYIGHARDLLEIISNIYLNNPDNSKDDQKLLTGYCKKNEDIFHIDDKNEYFFTKVAFLSEIDDHITIKNKDIVMVNDSRPFFVHVPLSLIHICRCRRRG